ncbi:MAG: HlyD family efflux transporter periplasmic adaptor subunit [Lachnospiraceae bacterium]|nr:HlyD family efflux transporter periplasmic adaptor subunit [Lachnospiraceae bacterium]
MRPIIIDMRDISDSTEVYDSRPNPILTGFIYLILALVATAFLWMGLFKMDVVVDAVGMVTAAEEVATITNRVAGTITERMIEDGQVVKQGDILYTISHEEQSIQLAFLEEQWNDCVKREELLKLYEAWLQDGNDFSLTAEENSYYREISTRKRLMELQREKEHWAEPELENLVAQEMYSIAEELETCRQTRNQLQQQISSLKKSIENATVKATISGTVNLVSELVPGDYISAGTKVLTIIPQGKENDFIVKSYVENGDIARIHEGMEVTYEIGAYPSREYGTMTGKVTFVSADLKVNDSGNAYYMVETTVNPGELRNRNGEEAVLKVGMLCETKVVIESKSVLDILMEKMFY